MDELDHRVVDNYEREDQMMDIICELLDINAERVIGQYGGMKNEVSFESDIDDIIYKTVHLEIKTYRDIYEDNYYSELMKTMFPNIKPSELYIYSYLRNIDEDHVFAIKIERITGRSRKDILTHYLYYWITK